MFFGARRHSVPAIVAQHFQRNRKRPRHSYSCEWRPKSLGSSRCPIAQLHPHCSRSLGWITPKQGLGTIHRRSYSSTCATQGKPRVHFMGSLCHQKRCFHQSHETPCTHLATPIAIERLSWILWQQALFVNQRIPC